jgi:hypothetical protein
MYQRALAFDFDGTIAENGHVPPALIRMFEQLHRAGHALFLVTGRRFESVALGPLHDLFMGIAWEDGAVLQYRNEQEIYLPFGRVEPHLLDVLEAGGVPLERGLAIAATWTPYEDLIWPILAEEGIDTSVVRNKGAVMLLPPGASKGTGLTRLLELCGFSPRNVVSFGDGENDLSLLKIAEIGIAVADAVAGLKEVASMVTSQPGPAGVLEVLQSHWIEKRPFDVPVRSERMILLGEDEEGESVSLPGPALAGQKIGIFGDSGAGKSWVTGLLVEGMHMAGYQVLLIDPEGDHRSLGSVPGIIALNGEPSTLPAPALVRLLLEETASSVILDLCGYQPDQRAAYLGHLFHVLRPLREHKFRPHWIVVEEAQQFLPLGANALSATLLPMLDGGGWAFVTYRPDRLSAEVLEGLNRCIVTRLSEPESVESLAARFPVPCAGVLAETPNGAVWLTGEQMVRLQTAHRRVPHIRHFYKYLDEPLPRHKRFYFRTEAGYLDVQAASLFEFKEQMAILPEESITYHHTRGDFARWVRSTLGDEALAAQLNKLERRQYLAGERLRQALLLRVNNHYNEIYAAR